MTLSHLPQALLMLVLSCLGLFVPVQAQTQIHPSFKTAPPANWVKPPQVPEPQVSNELISKQAAVIDGAYSQWRWQENKGSELYEHRVFRVQKNEGIQSLGTLRIPYNPDYQKLTLHRLRVQRQGQWIDRLPQADVRITQAQADFSKYMLTGQVFAVMQVQDLRIDDRIELAYTLAGDNPVFSGQVVMQLPWNSPYYAMVREVKAIYPKNIKLAHRFKGLVLSGVKTNEQQEGQQTIQTWSQEGVLPYLLEPQMPANILPMSFLQLSTFSDWADVRQWGEKLFAQPATSHPEIRSLVQRFRATSNNPRNLIDQAIRFVQDDIRYFSISVQENTHRPQPAHVTLERRFGDCKDKSVLLIALLQELGIQAHPVLVSAQEQRLVQMHLPSPAAFDHVVVTYRVNGQTFWVDPTRRVPGVPVSMQFNPLLGGLGLVLDPELKESVLTEMGNRMLHSTIEVSEEIKLDTLEGVAQLRSTWVGNQSMAENARARLEQLGDSDYKRAILHSASQRYEQSKSQDGYPRWANLPAQNRFAIMEAYQLARLMQRDPARNVWVTQFGAKQVLSALGTLPSTGQRIWPVALAMPFSGYTYRVKVNLPKNILGREDPMTSSMDNAYFMLRTSRSFRGSVFEFEARLVVLKDMVHAKDLPQLEKDLNEARKKILDVLVIDPETMVVEEGSQPKPMSDVYDAQYQSVIASTTRIIEANRLAPLDLAQTHLERGQSHWGLRQTDAAMADVEAALRLNPALGMALALRAELHTEMGRFELAEADYTRALGLSEKPESVYFSRGQMRYMQQRWSAALSDFEQAQRSSESGHNVGFMEIWQQLTQLNLNQKTDVKTVFQNKWPGPIQRFLSGQMSESELIEQAQRGGTTDEINGNLCEAYFYAALWHRVHKRNIESQALLKKVVETNVRNYMEYRWAQRLLNPTTR